MNQPTDGRNQKQALRKHVRDLRCSLSAETCIAHAEAAAENLLSLEELAGARVVMAYAATAEEIDPALAIESLHARGVVVAMPRVEAEGVLGVHLVGWGEDLEPGPLGIRQPAAHTPRVPLDTIDAVVVPGVAFDEAGYRLGYGGGYYDRLLPRLRDDCVRIGLAYDEQVVASLPAEDHDERVNAVVTPTRVIHVSSETDLQP
ncbi:MAG TPA: 5-formyltetrahydrofolate cyclo-ligase [Coriobacteriia bacterium]|nr:5-formyltetrahydrofolate cyclo-ligase [Coriobacteriia bacterium]